MSAAEIAFAEAPSRFSDVSCGQSAGDVFQLESRTLGSEDFPRTVGFNRLGVLQQAHSGDVSGSTQTPNVEERSALFSPVGRRVQSQQPIGRGWV